MNKKNHPHLSGKKAALVNAGLFILFGVLTLLLFREGWLNGMAIQGIDGNYSYLTLLRSNLMDGRSGWWGPSSWLGIGQPFGINSINFFLRLFPEHLELMAGYFVMIFTSLVFMWLLLRRVQFGSAAAAFGALAFGFTPHFITLVYPGHIDDVHLPALAAMLFYFLTAALDGQTPGRRTWFCLPAAGFAWGLMMNADVQRGLYFSVTAVAYALFLIFRDVKIRPFSFQQMVLPQRLIGIGKLLLAGLFMGLIFASNAQTLVGGELVSGKVAGVDAGSPQAEAEQWAFATSWSLNPKELLDSLAPGYHGMLSGDPDRPYWGARPVAHSNDGLGYFVVFFGLAGIVTSFRRCGRARFFAVAVLLATLLAFGEYWPGRPLFALWYHLPMMAKMRAPAKFMCVTAFALSILSAYGFQNLLKAILDDRQRDLKRWLIAFSGFIALGVIGLLSVISGKGAFPSEKAFDGAVHALLWMNLFSLLAAGLIAVAKFKNKFRCRSQIVRWGFLILLVFNLFLIDRFYIKRSWFNPSDFFRPDEIVSFLQKQKGDGRVACSLKMMYQGRMVPLSLMAARNMYVTHLFQYFRIEALEHTPQSRISDDYDSFFKTLLPEAPQATSPNQFVEKILNGQLRFWRLCGVRYVITDGYLYGASQQPIPVFELMKKNPALQLCFTGTGFGGRRLAVFELKDTMPQFALFSSVERVADRAGMIKRLGEEAFNPQSAVVLASAAAPEVQSSAGGSYPVRVLESRPGEIRLSCEVPAPSVLLWNSRFDGGWKADVDGHPAGLFPVNFIMTGLQVDAGLHEVTLRYNPDSGLQKISFGTAVVGLLCIPSFFLCLTRKKPFRESHPDR
ncbi:MAG: glycosyltransferase family 39 protein [Kiritimatiellales bacterium]|nr:glycosyltransferase family 39 protein [Kiritimatiellales bacterium]